MDREQLRKKGLLDTKEAASYIGHRPATLVNWRANKNPQGPKFINSNRIMYMVKDLDRWLEDHAVDPEIDYAS